MMYSNSDLLSLYMEQYLKMGDNEAPSCSFQDRKRPRDSECSDSTNSSFYRQSISPTPPQSPPEHIWPASPYSSNAWDQMIEQRRKEVEMCDVFSNASSSSTYQPQPQRQQGGDIEAEVYQQLISMRAPIPPNYVCHRCGLKGHWIKYCPTKNLNQERTPYQGNRPSIGLFRCSCSRHWKNEAQANRPQPCRSCRRPVYPHKMLAKPE